MMALCYVVTNIVVIHISVYVQIWLGNCIMLRSLDDVICLLFSLACALVPLMCVHIITNREMLMSCCDQPIDLWFIIYSHGGCPLQQVLARVS